MFVKALSVLIILAIILIPSFFREEAIQLISLDSEVGSVGVPLSPSLLEIKV